MEGRLKKAKRSEEIDWERVFRLAHEAGMRAGQACTPTPMIVGDEVVKEGTCGFAWVLIRPGTCAAACYAHKHLGASSSTSGGTRIWVSEFGQSMERKYAYARTFAAVLQEYGVQAIADCRLD